MINFPKIIKDGINNYPDNFIKDICAEFEVAESTVFRWSEGISEPLPKMRNLIIAFIKENYEQ